MTIGELAILFNTHFGINSNLQVVKMSGWKRSMLYNETGLKWINPSPNLKTLEGAIIYSGLGWLETTSLSMGRGTETPFELIGAPFINKKLLVEKLNEFHLSNIEIFPEEFTPKAKYHKHFGKKMSGN